MKTRIGKVIYRGIWPGLGEMYNIKVETGYTTIIVKSGEDLKKRTQETREKFARKDIWTSCFSRKSSIDGLSATNRDHFHEAH